MSDKLARAKHTHKAVERRLREQALIEQERNQQSVLPSISAPLDIITDVEKPEEITSSASSDVESVSSSAALMSVCVLLSRVTGFVRTWAMAIALGSTFVSSSYQIAYNLPSMLYDLVVGGILVTAFLPVYVSVKKKMGQKAGNQYASNLLTLVVIFLVIITVLSMIFPSAIIYTQSFMTDQNEMALAVFFFQFFAIQILFYGVSSVVSGLLNANRDYLWSSVAPVANNVIVIATFFIYIVIAPSSPELALYIIAIGNPLGVFVQMAIQFPALKSKGIKLRPHVDFKDPALKQTLSLGIPALIVVVCSFVVVSVQQAASLSFQDNGPSILAYARLWWTLPYAFLAVPITTTMFTELSELYSDNNKRGVKKGIVSGTNQILFFMIPFMLYLIVYAVPLVTLYQSGAFTAENVGEIARYLAVFALALPFYAVNMYLNKIFSSLHKMKTFALFNAAASVIQIALTLLATQLIVYGATIESIPLASFVFYALSDIALFVYLRRNLGRLKLSSTLKVSLKSFVLGALGAAAGYGVYYAMSTFIGPVSGTLHSLGYIIVCGLISLLITFGIGLKMRMPEAAFLTSIVSRLKR